MNILYTVVDGLPDLWKQQLVNVMLHSMESVSLHSMKLRELIADMAEQMRDQMMK